MSASNTYLINKPVDWTSFDVVKKIRDITHFKKVGHAGTLDPFATGLLIVLTGRHTKKSNEFMELTKTYRAQLHFGTKTDSGDIKGKIVEESQIPELEIKQIESVLKQFEGEITQIPPMFSAKRVNGRRLYKYARDGIEVDREPIKIFIYSIELNELLSDSLMFTVKCSKGTYVRTLGEDIASALGTIGYLKMLERTAIGDFKIEDSLTIEEFEEQWKLSAA